jgi:stage II sporulation protein D
MTKSARPSLLKVTPWKVTLGIAVLLPFPLWAVVQTYLHPKTESSAMIASPLPKANVAAPPLSPDPLHSTATSPHPSSIPSALAKKAALSPTTESKAAIEQRKRRLRDAIAPNIDSSVEIHVAIASGATALSIAVSGSGKLQDQTGKRLLTLNAEQTYGVEPAGQSMTVGGKAVSNAVWIVPDPKSLISLGDRTYRGTLLLVADGTQLWAVNYVNLRQYLHSVVGAEVSPSWPPHALKAQAIAARSYALTYYFKPVNQLYHLGSDEYYQVYKGVESEADATRSAVDETAGAFVSYRGGIVESLYAASDDIVAEAFQGHGMSQLGALSLAEQGNTYEQILANYYPKTKVGRIAIDPE